MKKVYSILISILFILSACGSPAAQTTEPSVTATLPVAIGTPTETGLPTLTSTPVVTASPMCVDEGCLASGMQLEFLIVTRPMFVEALQPYIDWKSQHGFRVGLVTVEWLDTSYEGRHLAEKMKTGMHDLRTRTGFRYVLLVGDTVVYPDLVGDWIAATPAGLLSSYNLSNAYNVPTGFYRRVNTDPASVVLVSDAYFVEDRDWDPENTGVNPRPDNMETGEGTLNADLYLGRWPVRTLEELNLVIQKTEATTLADSIFLAADKEIAPVICDAWPPYTEDRMACYQDIIHVGRRTFFDDNAPQLTTDYLLVYREDNEQTSALMEKILANRGVMVLNFHGSLDCLGVTSSCTPASAFQFQNIFPLLEIAACSVADFSNPSRSFMESMLLSPTGPVIVSASPSPVLYLRDLRDGKSAGEAFWGTASSWVYWPNPMLLLGDPSLPVFVPPAG